MTRGRNSSRPGRSRIHAIAVALALLAGCDVPTDSRATLRDFVLDFARNALAAVLL